MLKVHALEALNGNQRVAAAAGLTPSAVSTWPAVVPKNHWAALAKHSNGALCNPAWQRQRLLEHYQPEVKLRSTLDNSEDYGVAVKGSRILGYRIPEDKLLPHALHSYGAKCPTGAEWLRYCYGSKNPLGKSPFNLEVFEAWGKVHGQGCKSPTISTVRLLVGMAGQDVRHEAQTGTSLYESTFLQKVAMVSKANWQRRIKAHWRALRELYLELDFKSLQELFQEERQLEVACG